MGGYGVGSQPDSISASIMDIAPTVLYYLGVPVPTAMDGRPLLWAFEDTFQRKRPLTYSDVPIDRARETYSYSRDDEEELQSKLRALGYID